MNTNMKSTLALRGGVAGTVVVALLGCSESAPPIDSYQQWVGTKKPVTAPVRTAGPVVWKTPEGWTDRGASGMRLTTFVVQAGDPEVQCTVSIFPGDTGGVRANISRWLRQLGLATDAASLDATEAALQPIQTAGGWTASWVDFRANAKKENVPEALLGAIVPMEGQTLFVKLSGPLALLDAEADRVRGLIESLAPGGER